MSFFNSSALHTTVYKLVGFSSSYLTYHGDASGSSLKGGIFPKKGDLDKTASYRGITLSAHVAAKIYDRMILKQIVDTP